MTDSLRPLRLNALELLRQPGTERTIRIRLTPAALGVEHPTLRGHIAIDYLLESLHDGIVVKGTASIDWAAPCRRCLVAVNGTAAVEVEELHQRDVTDPDAFAIENGQLDLAPMTRELMLLALDNERLCRADCAGLCAVCGSNHNETSCGCDNTVRDDRWAALDELSFED